MDYIDRYEKLLQKQGVNFIRFDNTLLREYNQIIIPLGPILIDKPEIELDTQNLFSKLRGKLVWWSYKDDKNRNFAWYGVIKDKHFEIEDYTSSNVRNQIRKGLKSCEIKRITFKELSEKGYSVYTTALKKQRNNTIKSLDNFKTSILYMDGFEDIIHCWGVFYKTELIGYSLIYTYGDMEANISEIRINPEYNKMYASYALFHVLSEDYIKKLKFGYLSDGYKNLVHQTNIQELLINKFGFKKAPLSLNLTIRFPYNLILYLLYSFRKYLSYSSIIAVFELISIIKKQKRLPK